MPELGNKHDCYSCGAKFYDLGKPEPICPKCGANQKDAKPSTSAPEVSAARKRRKEEAAKREPDVVEDDVVIPEDDSDVLPTPEVDDADLDDDEDEVEDFADDHEE